MNKYTEEELLLIDQYRELPRKQCNKCEKEFPLNDIFFLKEKRIKDGFENKCRKCRRGNFKVREHKQNRPLINESLFTEFNSINESYEYYLKENVLPYHSFILDNHLEIFKYLVSKENISIHNLNELNRQWFQDRKLYSSLLRIYNGSVNHFVLAAYPNSFQPWEFTTVGRHYWKVKSNRIKALEWLVDELLKTNVINNIDEIPRKVNGDMFSSHGLKTLLAEYYNGHTYYAFNDLYPNKFYVWQYRFIMDGYLDDKENRIQALKELIEYLELDTKDIPKVLSYEYFNLSYEDEHLIKFKYIIDKYYNTLYDYVNEVYPNVFDKDELPYKNSYQTLDNIKVRSEPERALHHLFMRLGINYNYGDYVGRMSINDITVLPDWYIYSNGKIILVEYYGMLDMSIDFGYNDKYEKKEKLYKQLCNEDNDYLYLALYKDDLKNSFSGVLSKLKEYEII
ncbi:hypothetical protein [Bacillus xiapuensis]|uniref:Uncharacterized protein n=1 Tax=Bacillus xiapuensis TaxID=2014075 RepID=A0ABU6NAH4_9BACI|nr:hypothetical protein [Bacillus xiapuensis]